MTRVHEYAVRLLGERSMRYAYHDDESRARHELQKFTADKIAGAWRGLNSLRPDFPLAHRVGGPFELQQTRARAEDVHHRTAVLLDFDAACSSDSMSTNAEHDATITQAEKCCEWLAIEFGISRPKQISSGRGCQLHAAINLPADTTTDALVKSFLRSMQSRFPLIDAGMHDRPRLARLDGFWNRKSNCPTPDRPWRLATLLHPGEPGLITRAQIEAVIVHVGLPAPKQFTGSEKPDPEKVQRTIQRLAEWLDKIGVTLHEIVTLNDGRTLLRLNCCPANPLHTGSSAGIGISVSGRPQNFCRHTSCGGCWAEWRAAVEKKYGVPMHLGDRLIFSKGGK